MAYMDVILRDDVPKLGKSGQLVRVRSGFGRHYLVPKGIAVLATKKNKARMDHEQRVIALRRGKLLKTAEDLKARLEGMTVTISKRVGENEKLYGSVTNKEIAAALASQGVALDRKTIRMDEPLKTVGVHNLTVELDPEVQASLKVWVVSEE